MATKHTLDINTNQAKPFLRLLVGKKHLKCNFIHSQGSLTACQHKMIRKVRRSPRNQAGKGGKSYPFTFT
jgi:hypothetical protein